MLKLLFCACVANDRMLHNKLPVMTEAFMDREAERAMRKCCKWLDDNIDDSVTGSLRPLRSVQEAVMYKSELLVPSALPPTCSRYELLLCAALAANKCPPHVQMTPGTDIFPSGWQSNVVRKAWQQAAEACCLGSDTACKRVVNYVSQFDLGLASLEAARGRKRRSEECLAEQHDRIRKLLKRRE